MTEVSSSGESRPLGEIDLVRWAESLAGIARTGLAFTDNLYESERFEEVLAVAAEISAATAVGLDPNDQVQEWLAQVGERTAGYVTPKVAVAVIVGNDDGELLLIQRADSGTWLYPTGWADIGYSPAEVAVKEVWEETSMMIEVTELVSVVDGMRAGFTRIPMYSLVFRARLLGGELKGHPLETLDVGFFSRDRLPDGLDADTPWVRAAFDAIDGVSAATWFDRPRSLPWEPPEGRKI